MKGAHARPRTVIDSLFSNPGFKALLVYRFGRWLNGATGIASSLRLLLPLYRLLEGYYALAFDIRLEQSADIGPGLYIGHFGGIRLANCRLGQDCAIQQEVRLEPAREGGSGPVIGDRVWIGAHAAVKGAWRVGNGATIGAGCVVENDVAEGCLLLGNPGRVARVGYDNKSFL